MRAILLAGCWVALSLRCAAAADCHVDSYNFAWGSDAQTHMRVKTAFPCSSGFRVYGGGIQAMRVAQQAQHGTAAVSGVHRWAYRSASGFVGHDAFIVQISGQSMGRYVQSGNVNITVDVDVVP